MASKTLFQSIVGAFLPKAKAVNEAGGQAYEFDNKHALAQLAATGCLNSTYYVSDDVQLAKVLEVCEAVEPEFIARTALFGRERAYMKDMPALLCAVLSVKSPGLMAEIFDRVIDSPKMLRNFVQVMRSGVVGRKSLGTLPKRMILQWLEARTDEQLFHGSVGNSPSLADIIKMVHPKPRDDQRRALLGYLVGRDVNVEHLPRIVREFEAFKAQSVGCDSIATKLAAETGSASATPPDIPFQMLTALPLSTAQWKTIARNGSWQMTRMNLNTFARHGVFHDPELVQIIADRLRNEALIEKAKAFPYHLMVAYLNADADVPMPIREALQDAMEISIRNVPQVNGMVYVLPDISGSMHSAISGQRKGATSKVRCIDIAALIAAAVLRKNPTAEVIPFESDVVKCTLNPRDSVMTNANKLASLPCGGTNCSAPLRHLNERQAKGDLVIFVSDNESWLDSPRYGCYGGTSATETMKQWSLFKTRNPNARLICLDIQPVLTTQAKEQVDITNVGGFSDQVFSLFADVAAGRSSSDHWVKTIEAMRL